MPPASPGPALWAWPGTSPDASCCSADTMSTLSARPCLPAQPQEWDNYVALARAHSRATGPCEEGMRKGAEPPRDSSSRQPAAHSTGRGASGCRKGGHLVGESGSLEQGREGWEVDGRWGREHALTGSVIFYFLD